MKLCASWQENCSKQEVKRNPKSEARIPRSAGLNKHKGSKPQFFKQDLFEFRILDLGFVSDLDIGISDFFPLPFWLRLRRVRYMTANVAFFLALFVLRLEEKK